MKEKLESSKRWDKRWEKIQLRLQLLWIWFLKNLALFIKVAIVIVAILVATNVIGSEDFFVQLLHFDELETIDWASVRGIENAVAIVLSAIITALLFVKKTKHLAIEDIKSRELKIALIKAHLYFNEDGKLCKRIEELIDLDLDDDQKIGNTNIENTKDPNLLVGIGQAVSELKTVLTADLDNGEEVVIENEELHDDILEEETNMNLHNTNGMEIEEIQNDVKEILTENVKKNIFYRSWEKVSNSFKTFWKNTKSLWNAIKDPKIEDDLEKNKKTKKIKEKKVKTKKTDVEIVDVENDNVAQLEETKVHLEESKKISVDPEKEPAKITKEITRTDSKRKQIDNILADLK